jgi:GAF domain-containing protein
LLDIRLQLETINLKNAYDDKRFDSSIDKATGFHTQGILSVPIYDHRGRIIGVTQMINKLDGTDFDDDNVRTIVALNVFCGISLENSKLHETS